MNGKTPHRFKELLKICYCAMLPRNHLHSTESVLQKTKLPSFGLGCYKMGKQQTEKTILGAIEAGYQLFDTAQSYENEPDIGEAFKLSGLKRDNFFVVTKLSNNHGYNVAKKTLPQSLKNLRLDYVDLYLIHSPSKGKILETWKSFVELQQAGLAKRIGVSNFNIHHIEGLRKANLTLPEVNQIEHHPWNQQRQLVSYCQDKDISIMGYCPLARMQMISTEKNHIINILAMNHGKTASQILLRWSIQKNVITIPKTININRIKENIDIFDFKLTDNEIGLIDELECAHQIASINAINEPWTG